MNFTIERLSHHPGYTEKLVFLHWQATPRYLSQAAASAVRALTERFADFQFVALSGGKLIGTVFTLPFDWDGVAGNLPASLEEIISLADECRKLKKPARTLAVLEVVAADEHGSDILRQDILRSLKNQAGHYGFTSLATPVRPVKKCAHPLIPFGQYVNWKQDDGMPLDPELRLHREMGALVLGTMPDAVTIDGEIAEWEDWTGMRFTQSGEYIVDGAQKPVIIDKTNNRGYYTDARIWMVHKP